MKRFFIVDDYTSCPIWDAFLLETMLGLPSKPKGWSRKENGLPEGDWTVSYGIAPMATDGAYATAGIKKPDYEQLPSVFCVGEDGAVEVQHNVSAQQAANFIAARIS